jgi:hypothetical protein
MTKAPASASNNPQYGAATACSSDITMMPSSSLFNPTDPSLKLSPELLRFPAFSNRN